MLSTFFAAFGLLICLLLAVHMALPRPQQARLEAWGRRSALWLRELVLNLRHWRQRQSQRQQAAAEAAELIRRAKAREAVDREGNVYRPKQFDAKKRRDLH